MEIDNERYVGEATMAEDPKDAISLIIGDKAVTNEKLADGAVTTSKIKNKNVTPEKLSDSVLTDVIRPITDDLQNQIDSLEIGGLALSNVFGDNPHIGISQKTLTKAINAIWSKLSDITGETIQGISMVVNPSYYIGEDGCTVHITASSIDEDCMFEEIWFYWNNSEEPFAGSTEPTNHSEFNTEISETTSIKCRAKILGVWYEDIKLITHFSSYWLGFGADYQAVQTRKPISPVPPYMRSAYDLTANNGDHLFVILGEKFASGFIRADLNGMEIAMTKDTTTLPGYVIFTSENTYQAGTYNIDING